MPLPKWSIAQPVGVDMPVCAPGRFVKRDKGLLFRDGFVKRDGRGF